MRLRIVVAAAVAASLAVVSAVAMASGTAAKSRTATVVSVTLKEFTVSASTHVVSAGAVTFVAKNTGKLSHELVVVKTNAAPKALRVKASKASEVGVKGRIRTFAPGATKKLTLTLTPGKYLLICNIPGHYAAGQVTTLVVKPAAATPAASSKIAVSAFEMGYKPSATTVTHGTVTFTVTNTGKLPHDFSFGTALGGTALLQPGQTATLKVTFAKPGQYRFSCTVEGHAEAGMVGVLKVT
jgi:uncharacterized cupredoxin-like copper-binding protein